MATVKKVTVVRYLDAEGRRVKKGTPGAKRVAEKSPVYYGRYKKQGRWVRVPLFTDKQASEIRLADIIRAEERGEAGLVSPYKDHHEAGIEEHVTAYLDHLRVEGTNPKHLSERERLLRTVLRECGVKTLADLTADKVTQFVLNLKKKPTPNNPDPGPASARTKDTYRGAVHAFAEWCVPQRLKENPIRNAAKPKGVEVHKRRAETVENLMKLLKIAAERPLLEAMTVRKGPRAGERYADVRTEVRAALTLEGRERRLLYMTALLTGMRQGELDRLQVGHLRLTSENPAIKVAAQHDAKNKDDVWLPLLPEHAAELAAWVKDTGKGEGDLLFYVPEKPNKIFRRDLKMAGIPYKDADGRYFDFHSLRHCTDSYLMAAGVPPSVVMLFMRHKKPSLSMVTYNDPRLTDARKALGALPTLF